MTAFRDSDRLISAYLENGPVELPRDSYEAVDRAVRHTRQRAVIDPWRNEPVSNLSRAVLGAAALAIVAVVGIGITRVASPGSPTPPPTIAPSVVMSPSPGAASPSIDLTVAQPPVYRWPASLTAGTYTTSFAWDPAFEFTFTVPDGWQSLDINVAKNDRISLAFFPIAEVASPTCASPEPSASDARSADAVLASLDKLVSFDEAPVGARVGDRDARYVEFTANPPVGCAANGNVLFRTPSPTCPPGLCGGVGPAILGLEFGNVPHHERLWLMNVGRQVIAMNAVWKDDATPGELAELQSIIDSVRFETPLATQAPEPAPSGG